MRRLAHLLFLPLVAAAISPALAAADSVPPQTSTASQGPTPQPDPSGVAIRTSFENPGRLPVGSVIAAGRLRVGGTVRPYVAGQFVFLRSYRHGVKLATHSVPVRSAGNGIGRFSGLIGVGGRPGTISIRVSHRVTPQQGGFDAPARGIHVVRASVNPGERSASARLLQQELAGMHYAVSRSGGFDGATARAVIAFRKLAGLARSAQANRVVFERLAAGSGAFRVRYPGQGSHFEADLTHQVLAEVLSGGRVRQIFEMSSGKPSTPTVIGKFHVYMKTIGTNAKGMVDANYFIGGYAIHGYAEVPTYAASHGCLRIPVPDAGAVYAWAKFGYPVDVYNRKGGGSHRVNGTAGP